MGSRNIQEWFKLAFRLLVSEKWDVIAERVENGDPTYRWLREILITQLKSIVRGAWQTRLAAAAFSVKQRFEGLTGAIISEEEFLKEQYWLKDITGLFVFQPDSGLTASQKVLGGRLALLQNFLTNHDNPIEAGGVVCRIFTEIAFVDEVVKAIYEEKTDPKLAYDVKEMYDLTKEYAEKMKIPLEDLVELEFEPDCLPTEPAAEPYTPPETWVFGCYGDEDGQFSSPAKVEIDKEANYLVMDSDIDGGPGIVVHQRLQLFDPLGKLIKVILKRGEGKVNDMKDFCLNKSGNIIVADVDDEGRGRIQVFDYDGKQLMLINVDENNVNPDTFSRVLTVSIDEDDNIIAADMGNKCVWVYGPDGKVRSRFGEFGRHDGGFMDIRSAYAKGKEIYALDYGNPFNADLPITKVFDYDGNFIKSIWHDYTYCQIVFHTDGHIYTVQSEEIHRIDLDGNREVVAKKVEHDDELGALRFITSMTFHPDGRMVVSENSNHRIKVFKIEGESL